MAKRKRYGCVSPELTLMELSLEIGRTAGATGTAKAWFVGFIGMWLVGPVMVIIRTVYPAPSKHAKHKTKHEQFSHCTQSPVCELSKRLLFTDTSEKDVPKQLLPLSSQ